MHNMSCILSWLTLHGSVKKKCSWHYNSRQSRKQAYCKWLPKEHSDSLVRVRALIITWLSLGTHLLRLGF